MVDCNLLGKRLCRSEGRLPRLLQKPARESESFTSSLAIRASAEPACEGAASSRQCLVRPLPGFRKTAGKECSAIRFGSGPFDHTVKALFTREIEVQLLQRTMAAIFQQSGLAPASGVRLSNSHGRPSAPALTRLRIQQSDYTSATL